MSDAADKSNDDHWSRLASELGLEGEPTAASRSSKPVRRPEPADEPAESSEHNDDEIATPSRGRRRRPRAEREAETTALTEGETPAEPDLLDDEPPPERPRRGRKPADAEAEIVTEDRDESVAATEESVSPKDETPKRRRRRRSRKRRAAEHSETMAAESSESTDTDEETSDAETVAESADDEEPAPEVIADWNVPSWNDLIASLYRPDR